MYRLRPKFCHFSLMSLLNSGSLANSTTSCSTMISMALRQFGISCKSLSLTWEACGALVRLHVKVRSMHVFLWEAAKRGRERRRDDGSGEEEDDGTDEIYPEGVHLSEAHF